MIGRGRDQSKKEQERRAAVAEKRANLEAAVDAAATPADRRAAQWKLRRHDLGQWLAGLDLREAILMIGLAFIAGGIVLWGAIVVIVGGVAYGIVVVLMGWAWPPIALVIGWLVMWRRYRPGPLSPRTYVHDVWVRMPRRPVIAAIIGWVATLVLTAVTGSAVTNSAVHLIPPITGATSAMILGAVLVAHYRQVVTGTRSRSRIPRRGDGSGGTDLTPRGV